MKRIIKKIGKILIIYVVLSMTILGGISQGYTSAEVGSAVAGYALNLLEWGNKSENYCDDPNGSGYGPALRYTQSSLRDHHPNLGGSEPDLPWFYDCSSFACTMYNIVCNKNIINGDTSTIYNGSGAIFEDLGPVGDGSECLPGDLICGRKNDSGHVEIFISQQYGTGGAHSNHYKKKHEHPNSTAITNEDNQVSCYGLSGNKSISPDYGHIFRLREDVAATITDLNTTFTISGVGGTKGTGTMTNIDFSEFFFNGIPKGKYSLADGSGLFSLLIDFFVNLVDYIIGILTYIIRIVFVGFTALMDNLLSLTVNAITDTNVNTTDIQSTSAIKVEGVEEKDRKLTIESMVFNEFDLFDANIFDIGGEE